MAINVRGVAKAAEKIAPKAGKLADDFIGKLWGFGKSVKSAATPKAAKTANRIVGTSTGPSVSLGTKLQSPGAQALSNGSGKAPARVSKETAQSTFSQFTETEKMVSKMPDSVKKGPGWTTPFAKGAAKVSGAGLLMSGAGGAGLWALGKGRQEFWPTDNDVRMDQQKNAAALIEASQDGAAYGEQSNPSLPSNGQVSSNAMENLIPALDNIFSRGGSGGGGSYDVDSKAAEAAIAQAQSKSDLYSSITKWALIGGGLFIGWKILKANKRIPGTKIKVAT